MPSAFRLVVATLLCLTLTACAGHPAYARDDGDEAPSILILISLDGFHPDYLERGLTPTLRALADDGVRARWMEPSFPSKTFPNHYTIVTGLVPDRHGIVENTMLDPELGRFTLSNRDAVGDPRWWEGEPIWITAQRQGLRTATLFWPGSEAPILGRHPDQWLPYDAAMSVEQRLRRLFEWLDEPAGQRPRLLSLYLEQADTAGHVHGPNSSQVDAALAEVDQAVADLIAGLEARDLLRRTNLVIVSDHGMAELVPGNILYLEDLVDPEWIDVVSLSEISLFQPRNGHREQAEAALLAERDGIRCRRRQELPERWRYGRHPRVPDIVCLLDEGWRIVRRERFNPWQARAHANRGGHGFDPGSEAMRAIFIGHGPAFRPGLVVEPFQNIHVYALLAHLLEIQPAENDGDPAVTRPMLRR